MGRTMRSPVLVLRRVRSEIAGHEVHQESSDLVATRSSESRPAESYVDIQTGSFRPCDRFSMAVLVSRCFPTARRRISEFLPPFLARAVDCHRLRPSWARLPARGLDLALDLYFSLSSYCHMNYTRERTQSVDVWTFRRCLDRPSSLLSFAESFKRDA